MLGLDLDFYERTETGDWKARPFKTLLICLFISLITTAVLMLLSVSNWAEFKQDTCPVLAVWIFISLALWAILSPFIVIAVYNTAKKVNEKRAALNG